MTTRFIGTTWRGLCLCLVLLLAACSRAGDTRDDDAVGPAATPPADPPLGAGASAPAVVSAPELQAGAGGVGGAVAQAGMGSAAGAPAVMPMLDAGVEVPADAGTDTVGMPSCLADLAVDPEHLRELVGALSGVSDVVIDGQTVRITERTSAQGRERARKYLRDRYVALGWDVTDHVYATGTNLVAERAGKDDAFLVVSAHLDAVSSSPGADDDASGVVSGLAIAEALTGCELAHGVRVLAFDEEEAGLIGSLAYADSHASDLDLALGMLQLEMTGYDSDHDGAYLIVDCDMEESTPLSAAVLAAVDTLALPLHEHRYCTDASDHASFWAAGVPAIVVGEYFFGSTGNPDPNPCYHESCDTADLLDYEYMADVTSATALAVGTLVGAK